MILFTQQTKQQRLSALKEYKEFPERTSFVNNHIHTTYSFSPYSPTAAVYYAKMAGLQSAGIMDHDSICGAEEFIEAGKIINLPTTIGVECRLDFSNTALNGKFINHPDQKSCAYVALHGIPHTQINKVAAFFKPYIEQRMNRNKLMVNNLNNRFKSINLNYDYDIEPLSEYKNGGCVTERHILFALSLKLIKKFGKGRQLREFLSSDLNIAIPEKIGAYLDDKDNLHYEYDLLGALKSDIVASFYVPATSECPKPEHIVDLADDTRSILAYAYLGDIETSVTGDKKAQTFEDSYLDLLFSEIKRLGFHAVTYMPSRNTLPQLLRVQKLCAQNNLLEISGEDINSSRQSFICSALSKPEFSHLTDMTWALIGHEKAATESLDNAFFSPEIIKQFPSLKSRVNYFKNIGKTA